MPRYAENLPVLSAALLLSVLLLTPLTDAQQAIGSVPLQDATVNGALQVTQGHVELVGSTTVTAHDHTAQVSLARGGSVLICATSSLHVTAGKTLSTSPEPLLLALDRGAMEIEIPSTPGDAVMTPDLRFVPRSPGPLDLRLRVTRNGDTCVENRGASAPTLDISETFGDSKYELLAGQHVLFEHGNLQEVDDHETSPCGCPPPPTVSVAEAATPSAALTAPGGPTAAKQVEQQHPFPTAISEGLAPGGEVPAAPSGAPHAQVAATLSFNADGTHTPDSLDAPSATSSSSRALGSPVSPEVSSPSATPQQPAPKAEAPPPTQPPTAKDLAHRIGHFFKRVFGKL